MDRREVRGCAVGSDWEVVGAAFEAVLPVAGSERTALRFRTDRISTPRPSLTYELGGREHVVYDKDVGARPSLGWDRTWKRAGVLDLQALGATDWLQSARWIERDSEGRHPRTATDGSDNSLESACCRTSLSPVPTRDRENRATRCRNKERRKSVASRSAAAGQSVGVGEAS